MRSFQRDFNHLANLDPNFQRILDLYGTPNVPVRPEGFETLVKIILEQQVSLDSAKAAFDKLKVAAPNFTPGQILQLDDVQLRGAGLSRQKSAYVRDLASRIESGQLDLNFENTSETEIRQQIISVKGIGHWTADVYMMFALQLPDLIPLTDIGIAVTLRELWKVDSVGEMSILTRKWAPHRTAASFYLWHYYLKKRGRVIHL